MQYKIGQEHLVIAMHSVPMAYYESVLHPIDFFKMADNDDKKGSYAEYFCLDKHGGPPPLGPISVGGFCSGAARKLVHTVLYWVTK